jgi:hypothetical protein
MQRSGLALRLAVSFVLASSAVSWPKESPDNQTAPKVCVAVVTNRTTVSLFVERMTERLAKGLIEHKLIAVAMESPTTDDRELRPTLANSGELKRLECDFLVLTQVTNPKGNLTEPRIPPVTVGGKVPSTDASDPLGGSSGPVYRENLEIDFALFRAGKFAAMTNSNILAQPSGNVSDSLMQAMDRVANRVGHELKKK